MTDNNDLLARARALAHDLLGAPEIASLALDYLKAHLTPDQEFEPYREYLACCEVLRRLALVEEGKLIPACVGDRGEVGVYWYSLGDGYSVATGWEPGPDHPQTEVTLSRVKTPGGLDLDLWPSCVNFDEVRGIYPRPSKPMSRNPAAHCLRAYRPGRYPNPWLLALATYQAAELVKEAATNLAASNEHLVESMASLSDAMQAFGEAMA